MFAAEVVLALLMGLAISGGVVVGFEVFVDLGGLLASLLLDLGERLLEQRRGR